ncbi:MAG: hypothetical protein PF961_18440 [Planctomycetota bacterium]|jgi:hypothetical protein|nr:hypothetical protein [Planctomycetota bacterium]
MITTDDTWTWRQAAALCVAVVGAAALAQVSSPGTTVVLPALPWGIVIAAIPALIVFVIGLLWPRQAFFAGLGSVHLAACALVACMILAIPAAIWPQGTAAPEALQRFGFHQVFESLPFAAAAALIACNLSMACARRLRLIGFEPDFIATHLGLLIVIITAAGGSGSFLRGRVTLHEGAPPNALVLAHDGIRSAHLSAGLQLDDFVLEYWEPELRLVSGATHHRSQRQALEPGTKIALGSTHIRVQRYLSLCAVVAGVPQAFGQPGALPALEVTVSDSQGKQLAQGWLHAGGPFGEALYLPCGEAGTLVMEAPKARRFASHLRVHRADGVESVVLEVNQPLRLSGGWWLYQTGYDEKLGAASRTSIIEAVRDPAYPGIMAGALLLLLGVFGGLIRISREDQA